MTSLLLQPSDVETIPTFAIVEEAEVIEKRAPIRRVAPLVKRRAAEPSPARIVRLIASRSQREAKTDVAPLVNGAARIEALGAVSAVLVNQAASLAFFRSLKPTSAVHDPHVKPRP